MRLPLPARAPPHTTVDCGIVDTFSNLTLTSDSSTTYAWSQNGIAWPGESKKYTSSPNYQLSEIVPPPNWAERFPDGYTNSTPPPDLRADEHFQNWMRTAGLPTFTKLWGRNDGAKLPKGRYQIAVNLSEYMHDAFLLRLLWDGC